MTVRKRPKFKDRPPPPPPPPPPLPGGTSSLTAADCARIIRDDLLPAAMTRIPPGRFSKDKRRDDALWNWAGRFLALNILLGFLVVRGAAQDTTIKLRQGTIQGVKQESNNRNIYAYLGIPYAKPPVGDRRFKPPQRHDGWTTTKYATEFGAACPQPFLTGVKISEDCLTLNVWIPQLPRGTRKYPVVVMLEGEMFITSSPSRFPGEDLSSTDIVVVSINYRTNAFGFLSWQDGVLPGNLGLRDQSLAIQWVSENIDVFGGDLSRITILGHSAGAASAAYHLVHPWGQGAFQQMILLSGSNLSPWALSRNPRIASRRLSEHLGCGSVYSSTYLLDCLKSKNTNQIIKAVERLIEEGNPYYLFAPAVDDFLPQGESMVPVEPLRAMRENANRRIPVLVGLSELDGSVLLYIKREIVHMSYDDLMRYSHEILVPLVTTLANLGEDPTAVNRMIEYAYLDKAPDNRKDMLVLEIVKMFTDGLFKAPTVRFAEEASERGLTTFLLVNEFQSRDIYDSHTNISGALHGTEMVYLFSPTAYRQVFNAQLNYNEEIISDNIKRIVYTFANSGKPELTQYAPKWEKYTPQTPRYASLKSNQIHQGYQHHLIAFWNNLLPELGAMAFGRTSPGGSTGYPPIPTVITGEPSTDQPVQYQSAVWVLVAIILLLVGVIIAYIVCAKRRKRQNSGSLQDQ
ncbi:cholinesterase-like isoform X2 [Macrobrachium nipponense]|uniref:cholinesterase-like isoform X2 n=1 Tax=Macrobrachium nipponense TaxID=159736 RepID=UPI0030C8887C